MEKNIKQIFFVGVFPHPKRFIVDIPIMVIINEFSNECGIEDDEIDAYAPRSDRIAKGEPCREKCSRQAHEY